MGIMCSGRPVSVHSALVTGMTAPDARAAISAVLRAATGGPAAATGEPAAATGGPVTATGEPVTAIGKPVTAIGKPVTAIGAQAGRAVNARDAGPMRDVANGRGAVAGPAPTGRGAPHGRVLAQPRNPVTTGRRDNQAVATVRRAAIVTSSDRLAPRATAADRGRIRPQLPTARSGLTCRKASRPTS